LILNELCENSVKAGKSIARKDGSRHVFKGEILLDHWQTSIGTKVYFTGYSEQILGRKFEYMGINKQHNTWLYKPLPMSLVRYERGRGRTAHPQCSYLGLNHVYGHIRTTEYHSAALETACVHSIVSLYHRADSCESKMKNSSALQGSDPEYVLDLKQDCETALFNETNANEISFLPHLIKAFVNLSSSVSGVRVERCLTVNEASLNISLDPCVRYSLSLLPHLLPSSFSLQIASREARTATDLFPTAAVRSPPNSRWPTGHLPSCHPLASSPHCLPASQRILFYSPQRRQNFCLSFISTSNQTLPPQFFSCHPETTSLNPVDPSPFQREDGTIIQAMRTKLKRSLKSPEEQQRLRHQDLKNQRWLETDDIPLKLM
jgi:hypothetical protein